jgi:peptidyl-prolyl cis-trans isomerase A (cyclophilin A)
MLSVAVLAGAAVVGAVPQQSSGSLTGVVMDSAGGAIPGVTVILGMAGMPEIGRTVTTGNGSYSFANLNAGRYRLEVSLAGFGTVTCQDVTVRIGAQTTLNAMMSLQFEPNVQVPPAPQLCFDAGDALVDILTDDRRLSLLVVADTARAPKTAANFLEYVAAHAYDRGTLVRVDIPVARTSSGLPPRDAAGPRSVIEGRINSAFAGPIRPPIPLESTAVTGLKHVAGTLSMARGAAADSATSTFVILLDDDPSFDSGGRRYADRQGAAAFGRVVRGLDELRKLGSAPVTVGLFRRLPVVAR